MNINKVVRVVRIHAWIVTVMYFPCPCINFTKNQTLFIAASRHLLLTMDIYC